MRAAPPVSLSCPRDGAWRWLLTVVPALAAGVGAWWVLAHLEQPWWPALWPALAVAVIAWSRVEAAPVQLAWDGRQWLAGEQPGELAVALDLHAAMLLRWRSPTGKMIWLPVTARGAGPAWHGLRVAVHARVPVAEPPLHV